MRKDEQSADYSEAVCDHRWESGQWGVIVGVSKCSECGAVSRMSDFPELKKIRTTEGS